MEKDLLLDFQKGSVNKGGLLKVICNNLQFDMCTNGYNFWYKSVTIEMSWFH